MQDRTQETEMGERLADSTEPRVWVGCLACYNAGRLTGEWVDALEAAAFVPCTLVDYGGPHEEFWVMDHENFQGFLKGECSPTEAQETAEVMSEIEESGLPLEAVALWVANVGVDLHDLDRRAVEEAYEGEWDTEQEFAQEFAQEVAELDDAVWPLTYIDWESATRELMCDYTSLRSGSGRVYIFRDL